MRAAPVPADRTDVTLAALLVTIAVALRLWHLGWGLPGYADESLPLRITLAMRPLTTGSIDLDPHGFGIPSLAVYLHLAVQQVVYLTGRLTGLWTNAADYRLAAELAPGPIVLASRALSTACDALTVLAVWRIGRRVSRVAGLAAALLVAGSAPFISAARGVHAESIATALSLVAIERLLAWHDHLGRGRLALAALVTGLAAGAAYPAVALVVPLVTIVFARERRRGFPTALWAMALVLLAFAATTPFALLHRAAFARDLAGLWNAALPGAVPVAPLGDRLAALARNLGWPALGALALSPLLLRAGDRRPMALAIGLAFAGFAMPAMLAASAPVSGLLPVIATGALLASITMSVLLDRIPVDVRLPAALAALAVFTAMPVANGLGIARRGARDTRVAARRWCETHIGPDSLVIVESQGPDLMDGERWAAVREGPACRAASPAWRARVDALHPLRAVMIPFALNGSLENELRLTGLPPVTLEVAPRASAIDRIYYEPALFADADYVITTGAVRDRYLADPGLFPAQCRLYRALDRTAVVAARFPPTSDASGSEITVYRIDARARAALAQHGPLDPLWWTAAIPGDYRRLVSRLLDEERRVRDSLLSTPSDPGARGASGALIASPRPRTSPQAVIELPVPRPETEAEPGPRDADGDPAAWVTSLRPLYETHVARFAAAMSGSLAALGRDEGAARLAEANLAMMPEDVTSCVVAGVALARTGRWGRARVTIERTLAVLDPQRVDPTLELLYARVLAHTGEPERASEIDQRLATRPEGDPIAAAAKADRARLR
jgi:hypothetical protein